VKLAPEPKRLFVWLFVCVFSGISAYSQSDGSLDVIVRDNRGFPDPNAVLTLISEESIQIVKVGSSGEYHFTGLPSELHELRIWSPSFNDVTMPDIRIGGTDVKSLTITEELFSAPPPNSSAACPAFEWAPLPGVGKRIAYEERASEASVAGSIRQWPGISPISGVTVKIFRTGSANEASTATSDENGAFQFSNLDPGDYTVSVSREGYFKIADGPHFFVARKNLTHLGPIELYSERMSCDPVQVISPMIVPRVTPIPDLIPPVVTKKANKQ
jgi:hypothetical protein